MAQLTKKLLPKQYQQSTIISKVVLVISLFFVVTLVEFTLGYIQSSVIDSVRAYVRGEGLWAKAQKDAILDIYRFAHSKNPIYYEEFLKSIEINIGTENARKALIAQPPDFEKARQGLLQGRNHPDDINGMINLFIYFKNVHHFKRAIEIWEDGDELLHKLQALGIKINQARIANDDEKIKRYLGQLTLVNDQLTQKEYEFSLVLSEGARWLQNWATIVRVLIVVLILLFVFFYSRKIIQQIAATESSLRKSKGRFNSLYKTGLLGILDFHFDGSITSANDTFLEMLKYSEEDLKKGKLNWSKLTPEEFTEVDRIALEQVKSRGYCDPFEKEFYTKSGDTVSVILGGALFEDEKDEGLAFVIDETEKRKAVRQLRLTAAAFHASSNGIVIVDTQLKIIAVNESYLEMTGYEKESLIGTCPSIFNHDNMSTDQQQEMWLKLADEHTYITDLVDQTKNGKSLPVLMSINSIFNRKNVVTNYVIILTDISKRKAAEEKLKQLAHYDPLTKLPNRSLFTDLSNKAIQRAKRNNTKLALLFVDLDKFKPINDKHGHEIGDLVLMEISSQLINCVRENDTVARIGGDEFVILLEDLHEDNDAGEVAQKVIEAVNDPIEIQNYRFEVGCSIGIGLYPHDAEDVTDLIRFADIAMYAAKAAGRNRYYYFKPASN